MERDGGYAMWAIEEKATGAFAGQCGLRPVDSMQPPSGAPGPPAEGSRREFDLACHFNRSCWNKGYASEAAIAVHTHGLGPLGLNCIIAVAMPGNTGSWRVMEKAGMRCQGLADYYESRASGSTSQSRNGGGRQPPHEARQQLPAPAHRLRSARTSYRASARNSEAELHRSA